MKRVLFLLLWVLCLPFSARAWTGTIVHINDGDTVTLTRAGYDGTVTVRLYGIDAPELGQAFGRRAMLFTAWQLPAGTSVAVETLYTDPYGREVAVVRTEDATINEELIRAGLAWVYSRFCKAPFCSAWRQLEKKARREHLGLWREKNPLPPWTWRKKHPRRS